MFPKRTNKAAPSWINKHLANSIHTNFESHWQAICARCDITMGLFLGVLVKHKLSEKQMK